MIIKPAKAFSTIEHLKVCVLVSTLFFAFISSTSGLQWQMVADLFMTTNNHSTWRDILLAPLSMITLNYSSISLQMLFDFLMLNAFITPLVSFVFSFLGKRNFFLYAFGAAFIASASLHVVSISFNRPFLATTLFSPVIISMIALWALLHTKNTPAMFLFLPMKPITILALSCIIAGYSAATTYDWITVGALLFSLFYAYIISVLFIRLKSGNTTLEGFEEHLIDFSLWCQRLSWRLRSIFKR